MLSGILEDVVSIFLDVIVTRLHNIAHRTAQQTEKAAERRPGHEDMGKMRATAVSALA